MHAWFKHGSDTDLYLNTITAFQLWGKKLYKREYRSICSDLGYIG